jgi:hypothetical protein
MSAQPLSPESELLTLLNLAEDSPAVAERIHRLAAGRPDWRVLGALARSNQVVPFTLRRLQALGLADHLQDASLEELAERIRGQNRERSERAQVVFEALSRAGIEVIVLKGFLFAHALYRDPAYKKMNDVDLLVRSEDYGRAAEILAALGFASLDEFSGKDVGSSKTHHNTTFVGADLRCIVGLHWRLTSPLGPWKPDMPGVWLRRVPVQLGEASAFRMSWEDNLLHLCVHLPFYKIGLRELADAYNVVLASDSGFDWASFDRHVQVAHGEDAVYRLLALTDALMPLAIPGDLLQRWKQKTSRFTIDDTDARIADPNIILRSRSVHLGKIEKTYIVFKKAERYRERVRAWGNLWQLLLWPNQAELGRISGKPDAAGIADLIAARLNAPRKIWYALARDFGHTGLSMMLVLSALKVAKDTATIPFRADGRPFHELPEWKVLEAFE